MKVKREWTLHANILLHVIFFAPDTAISLMSLFISPLDMHAEGLQGFCHSFSASGTTFVRSVVCDHVPFVLAILVAYRHSETPISIRTLALIFRSGIPAPWSSSLSLPVLSNPAALLTGPHCCNNGRLNSHLWLVGASRPVHHGLGGRCQRVGKPMWLMSWGAEKGYVLRGGSPQDPQYGRQYALPVHRIICTSTKAICFVLTKM